MTPIIVILCIVALTLSVHGNYCDLHDIIIRQLRCSLAHFSRHVTDIIIIIIIIIVIIGLLRIKAAQNSKYTHFKT